MAKAKNKRDTGLPVEQEIVVSTEDILEMDDLISMEPIEEVETKPAQPQPAEPRFKGTDPIPVNQESGYQDRVRKVEELIRPVSDVKDDYLTLLGYGLNGTGKTTFGATAKNALFIDIEHGLKSVRHTDALYYPVNEWADVEALYWYLAGQPGGKHPKIDTLVWDTLTRLLRVAVRNAVLGEAEKDPTKDIINPTLKNWGDATERIIFWLSAFKKLPYHQIWLCQERATSDDVDAVGYLGFPDLSRALRNYIQGDADVIGRFEKRMDETGQVNFIFNVAPSDMYITRDRLNVLGSGMKNPNFEVILKLFRQGGKK